MPKLCKIFLLSTAVLAAVLVSGNGFAQDTVNSKYFSLTVRDGVSKAELLKKLRADYFLQMGPALFAGESKDKDIDALLARTLDAIYLSVSDVLDIHMYSFSVNLEIFPDRSALSLELWPYLNKKIDVPSFYFYDKNKIYISYADLTLGMLSHEVAHSIISHYFVVQPPAKVQEVLAGYVEYSLQKMVK